MALSELVYVISVGLQSAVVPQMPLVDIRVVDNVLAQQFEIGPAASRRNYNNFVVSHWFSSPTAQRKGVGEQREAGLGCGNWMIQRWSWLFGEGRQVHLAGCIFPCALDKLPPRRLSFPLRAGVMAKAAPSGVEIVPEP